MPTHQIMTDDEQAELRDAIGAWDPSNWDAGDMLNNECDEVTVADGDARVKVFPIGDGPSDLAPISALRAEVTIDKMADWYVKLGTFSADNLRNGGTVYEAFADELADAFEAEFDSRPEFVKKHGGGPFVAEVDY